jgi:hypothetical protein
MRTKLAYGFTLAAAAFCLSGCSYFRATGPCFGTGCPARTVGQSGQYKMGQGPKPATANASAAPRTTQPATPAPNAAPAPQPSAASRLLAKLPFVGRRSVN